MSRLRHELAAHGARQVALVEPGGYRTAFARNMVWGERPLPAGGRDARQLAAYRSMQEKLLARPGKDPAAVVRAVLALAEMETMPMRTRVGADAERVARQAVAAAEAGGGDGRRAVPPAWRRGQRMTPGDARDDALRRAADRLARRHAPAASPDGTRPLDAAYFGLDRIARFRDADPAVRQRVLDDCARGLLAESWRIERCGVEYCARA